MNRKILTLSIGCVLLAAPGSQSTSTTDDLTSMKQGASLNYERHREAAIQINELAGRIRSEADAQALVDGIADVLADALPTTWSSANVRQRVARAEYLATSEPAQRIPEQRVADIWNEYVQSIGAPEEALVTVVEIHSMRDGAYAVSQRMWTHWHNQTIWTMPNIFAVDATGKIAEGCRGVEVLRIIYDLDMMFGNLRSARKRIHEGVVLSEEIKKGDQENSASPKGTARVVVRASDNPMRPAEYNYIRQYGSENFSLVLVGLFDKLFPVSESLSGQEKSVSNSPSNEEFHIGSSDVLQISVYQHPELSRTAVVNQDGNITLPPFDALKVGGLSVHAAADLLRRKLEPMLSTPQVTVTVTEIHHGILHRVPFMLPRRGPSFRDVPAPDHLGCHVARIDA